MKTLKIKQNKSMKNILIVSSLMLSAGFTNLNTVNAAQPNAEATKLNVIASKSKKCISFDKSSDSFNLDSFITVEDDELKEIGATKDKKTPKLTINALEDGIQYELSILKSKKSNDALGFSLSFDIEKCLYEVKKLNKNETDAIGIKINQSSSKLTKADIARPINASTYYYHGGMVYTADPPGYWLAWTGNFFGYYSNGTSITSIASSNAYCGAANPTPLNTHWFVSYCPSTWPTIYGSYARQIKTGNYYNYDFLDPSSGTYVNHNSFCYGYANGSVSCSPSNSASGEGWWLLTHYMYLV